MADYIYLDDFTNTGKIAISASAFNDLVSMALTRVPGVAKTKKSKKALIFLNSPIKTSIRHGIAHIKVAIDIIKGTNIQAVSRQITDEIENTLMVLTEQVPFDVQIKVESII